MTAACPFPHQTGHADFPHPVFAWHLIWSIHHARVIWPPLAASLFIEGICFVMGLLQSVPSPAEDVCLRPSLPDSATENCENDDGQDFDEQNQIGNADDRRCQKFM